MQGHQGVQLGSRLLRQVNGKGTGNSKIEACCELKQRNHPIPALLQAEVGAQGSPTAIFTLARSPGGPVGQSRRVELLLSSLHDAFKFQHLAASNKVTTPFQPTKAKKTLTNSPQQGPVILKNLGFGVISSGLCDDVITYGDEMMNFVMNA